MPLHRVLFQFSIALRFALSVPCRDNQTLEEYTSSFQSALTSGSTSECNRLLFWFFWTGFFCPDSFVPQCFLRVILHGAFALPRPTYLRFRESSAPRNLPFQPDLQKGTERAGQRTTRNPVLFGAKKPCCLSNLHQVCFLDEIGRAHV